MNLNVKKNTPSPMLATPMQVLQKIVTNQLKYSPATRITCHFWARTRAPSLFVYSLHDDEVILFFRFFKKPPSLGTRSNKRILRKAHNIVLLTKDNNMSGKVVENALQHLWCWKVSFQRSENADGVTTFDMILSSKWIIESQNHNYVLTCTPLQQIVLTYIYPPQYIYFVKN